MFTGLITDTAEVKTIDQSRLEIVCKRPLNAEIGQSIAVSGCCLTVVETAGDWLVFDLNPETWAVTNFSSLQVADQVNIERSLRAEQLFDGHLVSGHVDTKGIIKTCQQQDDSRHYCIGFDPSFQKWTVAKGSIAIDGISLTINEVRDGEIQVCVIAHTYAMTNLAGKAIGDTVNLEFDMMAKFFEKQMQPYIDNVRCGPKGPST